MVEAIITLGHLSADYQCDGLPIQGQSARIKIINVEVLLVRWQFFLFNDFSTRYVCLNDHHNSSVFFASSWTRLNYSVI